MDNDRKALLWSKQQNCFHIEPMAQLLHKNLSAFLHDRPLNDYHLIAHGTDAEVRQVADAMRSSLNKRDEARARLTVTFL